jgi:immune inhibitor A
MQNENRVLYIIIGVAAVLLLCCLCVFICLGASLFLIRSGGQNVHVTWSAPLFSTSTVKTTPRAFRTATPSSTGAVSTPGGQFVQPPALSPQITPLGNALSPTEAAFFFAPAAETLKTLENAEVPVNDPIDLAERLKGKKDLPRSLEFPLKTYQLDDQETFWVTDTDSNRNSQLPASLAYMTDHVYFFVADGVVYDQKQLEALVDTFENEIYPKDRAFFGSEWTPGVDADPHLFILLAPGLGEHVAGYFSSADEYLPQVREDSNAHEMFILNADGVDLNDQFTYGVLAHEFQHMIHWYGDRNEETWMNEGFSDLAMLLNDYTVGGVDRAYVENTDMQLNDWPTDPSSRAAHYGASFLFLAYYLDRFGEEATRALVADVDNGMVSIDKVLSSLGIKDPQTGQPIGADDVFTDWVLASFLQDDSVGDGRYTYHDYPGAPNPYATESIADCPLDKTTRDVSQYGVDYIRIKCSGDYTLHFEGQQLVGVLPADPHSGSFVFYSNRGDESDMTLTRTFDFTSQSGPLTLDYWTWYDLEKDYDYLHLVASTDDGQTWSILTTPSGTADNPVGNSYGWGYNGLSGGSSGPEWIEEKVDISQFAGKKVQIRFEYVTDAAVNGEGFLLDDVSVPEIDYATDFENDDGGWVAGGFVRIQNVLPQTFRVSVIKVGNHTTVEKIDMPADNLVDIPLQFSNDVREIILVVSGTSRFTRQKAMYDITILPK